MLAVLLADVGRTIGPDVLIDRVWGDRPPAQAKNALHTYLARLRGLLGDDPPKLVKQPAGYRLDIGGSTVDLHHFRSLSGAACAAVAADEQGGTAAPGDRAVGRRTVGRHGRRLGR